ncbi:MAG: Co-activator of prophage gene expression IbrA [uncultured Caballeronia sp.]|nr:MAG: Co-activator of prophage gene expression IbrA [uncultured Caballeronia sp.]
MTCRTRPSASSRSMIGNSVTCGATPMKSVTLTTGYNDDMLRAGIAFSQMRICQPYGDDQRKGPRPVPSHRTEDLVQGGETGRRGKLCGALLPSAVSGLSRRHRSADVLRFLAGLCPFFCSGACRKDNGPSMPAASTALSQWWAKHGYPLDVWPDAGPPALENRRVQPSWRRVALSLLKQDMARSLSFGFANRTWRHGGAFGETSP